MTQYSFYKKLSASYCFAIPNHTILQFTTPHHTALYTTPHHTTLHSTPHYTTIQYITLHCAALQYNTLHYTTLHYTTLHDTTLHYTNLHYTTLIYTTLYYTSHATFTVHTYLSSSTWSRTSSGLHCPDIRSSLLSLTCQCIHTHTTTQPHN